jgi:hypothetical protein
MEEEIESSSEDSAETLKPTKYPIGMILLCIYLGYSLILKLWGLQDRTMLFGPLILSRFLIYSYYIIGVMILSISLIGVLKRKQWARSVVLGWFGFLILFTLTEFIVTLLYKSEVIELYQKLYPSYVGVGDLTIMLSKFFGVSIMLVINSIICWYVYSRKTFFYN